MKILITGTSGQLAQSLGELSKTIPQHQFHFTNRNEIDLLNPKMISSFVTDFSPDVIISAAAWTEVDLAEDEIDSTSLANAVAPEELAKAAKTCGAKLIHISTDYVFDGLKPEAYIETDTPNPNSVYGESKLLGEKNIASEMSDYLILRTAWVVSPFGKNFVKTMLSLAETRDHLMVVKDQFGNPTSAHDLAATIFSIIKHWNDDENAGLGEIFHCSGSGTTNWSGLAEKTFQVSEALGGASASVEGITGSQWSTKAKRPKNSALNNDKLAKTFGIVMPNWEVSVEKIITRLKT